ncbi:MAG TPA: response regulator transcription factor [Stellaceae bacterium]|nr:response regulator transcription factor [Stellaceae bacterium]
MDTNLAPDRAAPGSSEAAPLRLLFVSDVCFVREALATLLERDPSIAAVYCADQAETVALGLTAQADAVLVDSALPEGPAAVRQLRDIAPNIPVIACALRETVEEVVAWAEAGATGYLPNTVQLAQIVRVVRDLLAGQQTCSGRVAAGLLRRIAVAASLGNGGEAPSPARGLTRRERQIAELIAARFSDKDIARRLNISLATAKSHVHNLLGKLGVEHRGDVAAALHGRPASPPEETRIRVEPADSTSDLISSP